jgi:hypothetical protein
MIQPWAGSVFFLGAKLEFAVLVGGGNRGRRQHLVWQEARDNILPKQAETSCNDDDSLCSNERTCDYLTLSDTA